MVHLHAHSYFSFLAGASSPAELASRAATFHQSALALTDDWTLAGSAQHALACKDHGIKPIHGTRAIVDGVGLVFIAADHEGYANICDLLTVAHRDRLHPSLTLDDLKSHAQQGKTDALFVLADVSHLIRRSRCKEAVAFVAQLKEHFPGCLFIELVHHAREGDDLLNARLYRLASELGHPCVATNAVRHGALSDYKLYDALVCAKNGITVAKGHPDRPHNDAAFLCSEKYFAWTALPRDAIANSDAIARECYVDILCPEVVPPHATIPQGTCPQAYLRQLCLEGLRRRYPQGSRQAHRQMDEELRIIAALALDEFFLVVAEVIRFARNRGIRCSGRGSAANSVVAYLLGITEVDPIRHHLLFERFLHEGRKGMPDIDVDFDSSRRDEVISWMTLHWGEEHTAMTGTLYTLQLRSAVTEIAKVLGYPPHLIKQATKLVPPSGAHRIYEYREELAEALGDCKTLDVLCQLVGKLHDHPRHLSLHNGGMILSRKPLRYLSPIRTSANGVRQIEFCKDDVERMGLIKFDILGLRTLSVVSEAQSLIHLTERLDEVVSESFDIDAIPEDDEATFELIRTGETVGLFQIESTGQQNLLARTQPRCFDDLVIQVALFRPGPLQSGMVHPFIARLRGLARTIYPHTCLEPVLKSTFGIILFQEQVLQVCHVFAGLSHAEGDDFRRLMSKFRDAQEMESMREQFVLRAIETHRNTRHPVHPALANRVFDIIAAYVGYGFCKSHSAAFARTVYQTAYLKTHFPAQYMAAVLEHQPGSFPLQTFLEEAQRLGVPVLPVSLHRSEAKYSLEYDGDNTLSIRIPFSAINGITTEVAAEIVFERALAPFHSLAETVERLNLPFDSWEALARAGALDCFGKRREVLWQVRALLRGRDSQKKKDEQKKDDQSQQLRLDVVGLPPVPVLLPLDEYERLGWDFETMSLSTGPHALSFYRPALDRLGVLPICELRHVRAGSRVRVAGLVIERRRPPTANGMTFLFMGDETGRLPTSIFPAVYEQFKRTLRAPALILEGKIETGGVLSGDRYRSLQIDRMWPVEAICQRVTAVSPATSEMLPFRQRGAANRIVGGTVGYPGESPRQGVVQAHNRIAHNSAGAALAPTVKDTNSRYTSRRLEESF